MKQIIYYLFTFFNIYSVNSYSGENNQVKNKPPGFNFWYDSWVHLFANSTNIFAGVGNADRGGIYISTDYGKSWSDNGINWNESNPNFAENINCFAKIGSNLFVGTNYGVFLSSDIGKSWNSSDTGFSYQVMDLAVVGTDIYAGTTGEGIYRSTDNGASWNAVNNGLTNLSIYGLTSIGTNIFAGTTGGGVYYSTDNGTNWSATNSGLTNYMVNVLTSNGNDIYAGTDNGIFFSTNNGVSWKNISLGTPVDSIAIINISVLDSNLFVGTNGFGVWRYPLSQLETGITNNNSNMPLGFFLKQNYPNPFNPITTISYQIPISNFVSLEIYDALGEKINTLVSEYQNKGIHEVTYNAVNLPSGIYFYRLVSGSFITTKKLILIK
ncbi:MAG: T9SS type A sorting domain-containing protein [Ignavibacteriaceae bacterium]|nr:T9SS type A sorting domain-containing protein [Ignavibacteriaceae bacterium]